MGEIILYVAIGFLIGGFANAWSEMRSKEIADRDSKDPII